jgi:ER lumen protein retaining receptor
VLALLIHPSTSHVLVNRICWAFCVYLEAVSVLPQLRLMQNTKVHTDVQVHTLYLATRTGVFNFTLSVLIMYVPYVFCILYVKIVEPFTAHYVFALGVARFLSCAHWVLQVIFSSILIFRKYLHFIQNLYLVLGILLMFCCLSC